MAVFFADSFDHYGTGTSNAAKMLSGEGSWTNYNLNTRTYPNTTQKRTGPASLIITDHGNARIAKGFSGRMTVGLAFGSYWSTLSQTGNNRGTVTFRNVADAQIAGMIYNPDGSISLVGSDSTAIVTSAGGIIGSGAWYHLEMKVIVSATVGYLELRVDGITVAVATDLNLGSVPISIIQYHGAFSGTGIDTRYVDDVVMWDSTGADNSDFMGQVRVYTMYPGADLSPFSWTITGAGTGAEAVDEVPPDADTSYIEAPDIGNHAEFSLPTLPVDVVSVAAVYVVPMARITSGGVGNIQIGIHSDGEVDLGIVKSLNTSYAYRGSAFQTDPDGDVPWTRDKLQNATISIDRVT